MQTHDGAREPSAFLDLEVESSAHGSDTAVRLEEHMRALERELSDVSAEVEPVRAEAEVEAEAWAAEHARFEQQETHWAQAADGVETERARWEHEREELANGSIVFTGLAAQAKDQVTATRTDCARSCSPSASRSSRASPV
jgi:hypothetical protein